MVEESRLEKQDSPSWVEDIAHEGEREREIKRMEGAAAEDGPPAAHGDSAEEAEGAEVS